MTTLHEASLRHAKYYLEALDRLDTAYLRGGNELGEAVRRLDMEWLNIRVAQGWAAGAATGSSDVAELVVLYASIGARLLAFRIAPRERLSWFIAADEALRRWTGIKQPRNQLTNIGQAYARVGDYPTAIGCYERQIEISRTSNAKLTEARALVNLAGALRVTGRPADAIGMLERALEIAREEKSRRVESLALASLGNVYSAMNEYSRAMEVWEAAIGLARSARETALELALLICLGNGWLMAGDLSRAEENYAQSLTRSRELGDRGGEAKALTGLGHVSERSGEVERAKACYEEALRVAEAAGLPVEASEAFLRLGQTCRKLGDFAEAKRILAQCLDLARRYSRAGFEVRTLGMLARVLEAERDFIAAAEMLRHQQERARAIGDRREEASALLSLGRVAYRSGDRAAAITWTEAAVELLKRIDAPEIPVIEAQLVRWRAEIRDESTTTSISRAHQLDPLSPPQGVTGLSQPEPDPASV